MCFSRDYMSVYLYFFLFSRPCRFLVIIKHGRNCEQHMRLHATGSNPLSGSIICLPFHLTVHLSIQPFIHLSIRPSIRPSICPYVHPSIFPSIHMSIRTSIRLSIRPSGRPQAFCNFCICIYFQCGVLVSRCIFPTLGSRGSQWGPVKLMCPCIRLLFSLSAVLSVSLFGKHSPGPQLRAAHADAGHGFRSIIYTVV